MTARTDAGLSHDCPCTAADAGWHVRKGPGPVLAARHGLDPRIGPPAPWIDHAYRVRRPDGVTVYVAEPYGLDGDAVADLAFLADRGFSVSVTAWQVRHSPGDCLAVHIVEETKINKGFRGEAS